MKKMRMESLDMTAQNIDKIGELFPNCITETVDVDKARTNDGDSHGLGLAIAYGIAQEHGGTLEASSTPENGTTFTARLPL